MKIYQVTDQEGNRLTGGFDNKQVALDWLKAFKKYAKVEEDEG